MNFKIGIIGFGNIGRKLLEKLSTNSHWQVAFMADVDGVWLPPFRERVPDQTKRVADYCQDVKLVFLAIPTVDDGEVAKNYITTLHRMGIRVVTCEKGALGNWFEALQPLLKDIGYSASVGGGSGIIHALRHRFFLGTQEVHAILNGTLNYIWTGLASGSPLGHIVNETQRLGYAEPGQRDPIAIIMGEASADVIKKTTILFNLCFQSATVLHARDIAVELTPEKIRRAIAEAVSRRFVVTFERRDRAKTDDGTIVAFRHAIDDWVITGGWRRLDHPLIKRLCDGCLWVNNAILTVEGDFDGEDGVYISSGDGAGPGPTTAAMIRDAEKLLS